MKKIPVILSLCFLLLAVNNATGQTASVDNKIAESITFKEPPKGPIYGVFEGRTRCAEVMRQFNLPSSRECDHLKWQIIFYWDSITHQPTTLNLTCEIFDNKPVTGRWKISKGSKTDPAAVIYELELAVTPKPFYLLKGDDNVLFMLDENRDLRPGDLYYSYTLNRVIKVHRDSYP